MAKLGVVVLGVGDPARPATPPPSSAGVRCSSNYGVNCCTRDEHDERAAHAERLRGGRRRARCPCTPCSSPPAGRARSWTGTTTTATTRTSACSSTAGTGRRRSCRTRRIATAPILGTTLGEQNTFGALAGRTPGGSPVTFGRVSTDDRNGRDRRVRRRGALHRRSAEDLRRRARSSRCPGLQRLMRFICRQRVRAPRRDERLGVRRRSLAEAMRHLPRVGRPRARAVGGNAGLQVKPTERRVLPMRGSADMTGGRSA